MTTYKWDAGDYKKHSGEQQKWAGELIKKLKPDPSDDVLDVGCGDGKVSAELAGYVPDGSVTAVDSSEDMIRIARESFPNNKNDNLLFKQMDAARLTFGSQFDIVFSNAALHWVKDHKPVLRGIYNSLRPGGRILLQMGGKGNAADIIAVVNQLIKENRWRPFFEGFSFPYGFHGVEEYRLWLEEAGFEVLRVQLVPKDMVYENREGLEGWIRTTWLPYTLRVSDELRHQFIRQLASIYIDRIPPDSQGCIHVAMVRLEVEARRRM